MGAMSTRILHLSPQARDSNARAMFRLLIMITCTFSSRTIQFSYRNRTSRSFALWVVQRQSDGRTGMHNHDIGNQVNKAPVPAKR